MITFLKVQAGSIIGSFADFLVTIILVQVFHCWYLAANTIGNISGNLTQFFIFRNLVFKADANAKIVSQFPRYLLVWTGNLLLSAAGVFLLTHYGRLNYLISKTIISVLLGLSYNYLLQKYFVFAKPQPPHQSKGY
ncbi:GtrA family protein [Flavitalea flava]